MDNLNTKSFLAIIFPTSVKKKNSQKKFLIKTKTKTLLEILKKKN